jgi:hypothetical protein
MVSTPTQEIQITNAPELAASLVAFYPFNGNSNDLSGNGLSGAIKGAIQTTDRFGQANQAFAFDGIDDSIQIPDSPLFHLTRQISLAVWINPWVQKTQVVIRKGVDVNGDKAAPYSLFLNATGEVVFSLRPDFQYTEVRKSGYSLNEWVFVVGTYDGKTVRLYVNGYLVDFVPASGLLNENNSSLLIGTRLGLPADTFKGQIDEIHIYDRALKVEEITALYEKR